MKRTQDEEEDEERVFQLGVFSLISSFSSRYFHIIFLFPFFFLSPLGFLFLLFRDDKGRTAHVYVVHFEIGGVRCL